MWNIKKDDSTDSRNCVQALTQALKIFFAVGLDGLIISMLISSDVNILSVFFVLTVLVRVSILYFNLLRKIP